MHKITVFLKHNTTHPTELTASIR